MEGLVVSGAAVPIYSYRRNRSSSLNSKKPTFFIKSSSSKKKKKKDKDKEKEKDDGRSSTSSDRPVVKGSNKPSADDPMQPPPVHLSQPPQPQPQPPLPAASHQSRSPTASTISLPPPEEPRLNTARHQRQSSSNSNSTSRSLRRPSTGQQYTSDRETDLPNQPLSNLVRSFNAKPEGLEMAAIANDFARTQVNNRGVDVSETLINFGMGPAAGGLNYGQPNPSSQFNPIATFQHIQDMAAKRVSTLDYLRKTHEGRVYWFNTLLFTRSDINRLPSFDARRLAKRATNFLLLGLSLPMILDSNTTNPLDYLRSLNTLLLDFEAYQQMHPTDGSTSSSLSRARIPGLFKRSNNPRRRTSSAAEIGLPINTSDPSDLKSMSNGMSSTSNGTVSFATSEQELLPGKEYSYLMTPSLPFDPDFFEVFATLCDVLIDCYMRITSLVSSPAQCAPGVAEMFAKTDARLRKVIVAGIIKEFEDATRAGVKGEVAGIGKVVLGGLM